MLAVLELTDFALLGVLVAVAIVIAALRSSPASFQWSDGARLRRIEEKLDLILKELNLEYQSSIPTMGLSEEVRKLAENPAQKIEAIRVHREQTGLGLKEAKDAVEAYLNSAR